MFNLDKPINLDVAQFFRWWGSELSFLVPQQLRDFLDYTPNRLIVSKNADAFELISKTKQANRHLGSFNPVESSPESINKVLSENDELRDAEIVLRLAPDQALQKTLTLPAAAAENLTQVMAFEMERQTPFKAEQVYYAARIIEKLNEDNQVKVELIVVPRAKLDKLIDELLILDIQPARVVVADQQENDFGGGAGYNLLPKHLRAKPNNVPKIINGGLLAFLVFLIIATALIPIWLKRDHKAYLQGEVNEISKHAEKVEAIKTDTDNFLLETGFLLDKKRTQPVLVETLNELALRIPDHTWLTNLSYRENRLQMQGQSPSASALIEIIEASNLFRNTSFVSPVTEDRLTGLERFQIATEVINGRQVDRSSE